MKIKEAVNLLYKTQQIVNEDRIWLLVQDAAKRPQALRKSGITLLSMSSSSSVQDVTRPSRHITVRAN